MTKDSVYRILRESPDNFISGEELAKKLDVSRTAVWKAIRQLKTEGYAIEAVTNQGSSI